MNRSGTRNPRASGASPRARKQPAGKKFKFRPSGTSLYDLSFNPNQTWVKTTNEAESLRFIDQGPSLRFAGAIDDPDVPEVASEDAITTTNPFLKGSGWPRENPSIPSNEDIVTTPSSAPSHAIRGFSSTADEESLSDLLSHHQVHSPFRTVSSGASIRDAEAPLLARQDSNFCVSSSASQFVWPEAFEAPHCAALMLFFVETLGPMGDIGDPYRHGTLTVPYRARQCPPLLNAVLAISAIVIYSSPAYHTSDGVCQYRGVSLPSLTYEKILQHHTDCVTHLVGLCDDPAFAEDENLLAALVGLRFFEEMDKHQTGEDKERLLNSVRFVLNVQSKIAMRDIGYQSPVHGIGAQNAVPALTYLRSFRHAQFRSALRQELTAAYLTQRGVQYPLEAWAFLDTLESPSDEDLIWSDRHLLHCARVLNFCYGSGGTDGASSAERWRDLKCYEARWQEQMPTSFLPLLEGRPDRASGQFLYRVWYLSPLHLTAVQFYDLARVLLLVMDPTVPRLGPRAAIARQRVSAEVRRTVLHLCSIAASYPDLAPAWHQATMAISIFGEFFTTRQERNLLLNVLRFLEQTHGWPTSQNASILRDAWNQDADSPGS